MSNLRQHGRDRMGHRLFAFVTVLVLMVVVQALPVPAQEADEARSALRNLSSAFTQVV